MVYFVALLIFVLSYVIIKFLLEKIPALANIVEVTAIVGAALAALYYAGVLGVK